MTEGSLFAGIGGFTEGFHRAGFDCKWLVEIEPFCQAVLKSRFPKAELFADVKTCGKNLAAVDVITAGFPCQDLSVAGKRAGLAGARSGLFWEVVRILGELRPPWFVLENVPGLFSSNSGRDFGVVLNALDELGYGLAWRVLDSRFFGVAQRRRRVFIVGRFGKPCPQEILFESESSAGDFAEGGETGAGVAREVASSLGGAGRSGGYQPNAEQAAGGHLIVKRRGGFGWSESTDGLSPTLEATSGSHQRGSELTPLAAAPITASYGKQIDSSDRNGGPPNLVAFTLPSEHRGIGNGHNTNYVSAPSDAHGMRDFTGLPQGLDSARYRALGNAVTVNVAQWIAERIKRAEGA